ncbi:alpha/beta fold hydrolase [Planctomycetota bacterium]
MGADERMFEAQRSLPYRLLVPPNISPDPSEDTNKYAKRIVRTLNVEQPYFLGGASFGGILAQAMCQWMDPHGLILIGSCRNSSAIPGYYRVMEKVFHIIPDIAIDMVPKSWPIAFGKFGQLNNEQKNLFVAMLKDQTVEELKLKGRMILDVKEDFNIECPIFHIHGEKDKLIPVGNVSPDQVVPGGGHLISMTHPDEVNKFIINILEK